MFVWPQRRVRRYHGRALAVAAAGAFRSAATDDRLSPASVAVAACFRKVRRVVELIGERLKDQWPRPRGREWLAPSQSIAGRSARPVDASRQLEAGPSSPACHRADAPGLSVR